VRVQRAEHAFKRAVDEILVAELVAVDVLLTHSIQDSGEQPKIGQGIVLLRSLNIIEVSDGTEEQIDCEGSEQHPVENTTFHITRKLILRTL
jgi:hypothetical protein